MLFYLMPTPLLYRSVRLVMRREALNRVRRQDDEALIRVI